MRSGRIQPHSKQGNVSIQMRPASAQNPTLTVGGFRSGSSSGFEDGNSFSNSRQCSAGVRDSVNRHIANLANSKIILQENPSTPNSDSLVAYRSPEERAINRDRLSLDRRGLTACPILKDEEGLRLLNYQHNLITRIQHVHNLRKLIFLDLYDNKIEMINGLASLKSLRVLMLGRNKISRIEGLEQLTKLDVLDLHGNSICEIENLDHLKELRVLNLAGNQLEYVANLSGVECLTELNLRRNKIREVYDIDRLTNLQRCFLSFNNILTFENIDSVMKSPSLSELTLDGNPVCVDSNFRIHVIKAMPQLKLLDMKKIAISCDETCDRMLEQVTDQ